VACHHAHARYEVEKDVACHHALARYEVKKSLACGGHGHGLVSIPPRPRRVAPEDELQSELGKLDQYNVTFVPEDELVHDVFE
jgi:hypothetical protein